MPISFLTLTFGRLQEGRINVHQARPGVKPYKISAISLKGEGDTLSSKTVHGEFLDGRYSQHEPNNFLAMYSMPTVHEMVAVNIRQQGDTFHFNCNSPPEHPSPLYYVKTDELTKTQEMPSEDVAPLAEKISSPRREDDDTIRQNYLEEIRDAFTLRAELLKARTSPLKPIPS